MGSEVETLSLALSSDTRIGFIRSWSLGGLSEVALCWAEKPGSWR